MAPQHRLSSSIVQTALVSLTDIRTVLRDVANTTITDTPNHPVPSNPAAHSYVPVWQSFVVPIVVVAGIICTVLYLVFTCYRKPFGERIRPHFSKFLLGMTHPLEDVPDATALEMGVHSTNRSRPTHGQGRDRPSHNVSDMQW